VLQLQEGRNRAEPPGCATHYKKEGRNMEVPFSMIQIQKKTVSYYLILEFMFVSKMLISELYNRKELQAIHNSKAKKERSHILDSHQMSRWHTPLSRKKINLRLRKTK